MRSSATKPEGEYRRDYSWMECILHVTDISRLNSEKLSILDNEFASLTVAGPASRPDNLKQSIAWHQYNAEQHGKAEVWNKLLAKSKSDWILFLEQGEDMRFYRLPEKDGLDPKTWGPACITRVDGNSEKNFYQVRLVHSSARSPFAGKNLTDCTNYIMQHGIHLHDHPILLQRTTDGTALIDPAAEMSITNVSPKVYLVQGERLMEERKYVHAAAQYRKVLKAEKLLPFDRLGAVNGLARCYTEQYKWPKALHLVEKSIEAEPVQRIPYLIQFRIYQLNRQWADAYKALKGYQDQLNIPSRSTFDMAINEEETLSKLGELAIKAGLKKEAFEHLEELYSDKKEKFDRKLLRKLMMLSIELENRERAAFYFNEIYKESFPFDLTEKQVTELNDYMTLFMNNGWFIFVAEIYEELYAKFSDNSEYRRRLIVALTKTNRMERARKLIAI